MDINDIRGNGYVSGMLTMLAAWGGNWLITPAAHPDASSVRVAGVVAQVVVCAVLAIWFWRRAVRSAKPAQASA